MLDARTWTLIALLYAAAVSLYVAYRLTDEYGIATDGLVFQYAIQRFTWLLIGGAGFAAMVAVLDLFVGRPQQVVAALALGLTIAATYEAGQHAAYEFTHADWKQNERAAKPAR